MKLIYDILPVNNYQGNGACDKFDFDFYIENKNQLKVYFFDENSLKTELINDLDYSIHEVGNKNGSYITFPIESSKYTILCSNQKISIELDLQAHQLTQYNNSSLLNLSALENSFDYLTRLIQILKRKLELCVKVDEFSSNTPQNLMDTLSNNVKIAQQSATVAAESVETIAAQGEQLISDMSSQVSKMEELANDTEQTVAQKANISADNFTSAGKSLIASYPAPSSKFINLTLGAADTAYTAPACGWFCIEMNGESGQFLRIINSKNDLMSIVHASSTYYVAVNMPVAKGDTVKVSYTLTGEARIFRFVYAEGEV